MPHRSVAIANEFLSLPEAQETLTQMQLQKLAYIAHGWNLVINRRPLINEPVEAWDYGPVYRDLYDHTKYYGSEPIGRLISPDDSDIGAFFLEGGRNRRSPLRASLNSRERDVLQRVWNRYGSIDAIGLSRLTHQHGTPWYQIYTKHGRDNVIPENLIRVHYEQLAERARAAS